MLICCLNKYIYINIQEIKHIQISNFSVLEEDLFLNLWWKICPCYRISFYRNPFECGFWAKAKKIFTSWNLKHCLVTPFRLSFGEFFFRGLENSWRNGGRWTKNLWINGSYFEAEKPYSRRREGWIHRNVRNFGGGIGCKNISLSNMQSLIYIVKYRKMCCFLLP